MPSIKYVRLLLVQKKKRQIILLKNELAMSVYLSI